MKKEQALQVLARHKQGNALVFARAEEIQELPPQYEIIVTAVELSQKDFAPVGGGNFYPMKSGTNRIADAAGVSFTSNCGTRVIGNWNGVHVEERDGAFEAVGEYAVIGYAQGYRLGPDGQPRYSQICEYEFNVLDRCNLEKFLGKFRPKTKIDARKQLLEMKKFATRRASTGAQLAVIRELAGIPTAFSQDEISRPLVVSQVVESSTYKSQIIHDLSKHPDGRKAIADAMLGTKANLYGGGHAPAISEHSPSTKETPMRDVTEAAASVEPDDDLFDDIDDFGDEPEMDERSELCVRLEEYLNTGLIPKSGVERINNHLNGVKEGKDISIEALKDLVDRCEKAVQRQGGAA